MLLSIEAFFDFTPFLFTFFLGKKVTKKSFRNRPFQYSKCQSRMLLATFLFLFVFF